MNPERCAVTFAVRGNVAIYKAVATDYDVVTNGDPHGDYCVWTYIAVIADGHVCGGGW